MKVVLLTSFPRDPAYPHGGVEAVSVNLIKALARTPDTEVHVVTADFNLASIEKSPWENAVIHRLPAAGRNLLLYATGTGRRQIHRYIGLLNPDVVHAHDTYGIMAKGLRIPRVFTVHGFIHEDTRFGGQRMARLRALLWKWVETASWREQPHIVSISPYVRERLRGIADGVIHDIENPIAEECFNIQSSLAEPIIFSAAVICERKNTLGLLSAFRILSVRNRNARLRLAGKVTEPAYGRLIEAFIAANGLGNRVDLLGTCSAEKVRSEIAAASIFALVSFEEGAPMGIAESMAGGLPVVASNRCGMPYMVRHGETGFLVDPNDPEDVQSCMGQILCDRKLAEKMSRRARESAIERFHPDRVAGRTRGVYLEAMASFRAKRSSFDLPK